MSPKPPPATRPLFHAGQELYMQRDVKQLPRGAKVKVRRWMLSGRELRYEVEFEFERHWCYEYDMAKQFVS